MSYVYFFFSSRRRHTRCALVTGVQTCALPISILGNLPVNVARPQHRAGKAWVVRRVGEALGFEAQPGTGTVLSGIEHVSVIELQGRFGRRDLQRDAGPRTGQPGNRPDTAVGRGRQHKGMVIGEITDRAWAAEIEGRAGDRDRKSTRLNSSH